MLILALLFSQLRSKSNNCHAWLCHGAFFRPEFVFPGTFTLFSFPKMRRISKEINPLKRKKKKFRTRKKEVWLRGKTGAGGLRNPFFKKNYRRGFFSAGFDLIGIPPCLDSLIQRPAAKDCFQSRPDRSPLIFPFIRCTKKKVKRNGPPFPALFL